MARMNPIRVLLPALALLAGTVGATAQTAATGATEHTQYVSVWVSDPDRPEVVRSAGLLNIPPGWSRGDAAAVISPGAWPDGLRDRLVAALLESGAGVLELSLGRAGGDGREALARDMAGALNLLRDVQGAGVVVTLGFGAGGEAALAAERLAPAESGGFAAAVHLGPGAPAFAAGAVPQEEAWPARAPLLCGLLAGVQRAGAEAFDADCRNGLLASR